jgi:precorrin-2 dehydrogenase / sirohydrochlorin ferrochelatase
LLMDFKLDGKTVVVVGGGLEGYRKTQNFVDSGAQITVVSGEFSEGIKSLAEQGKIRLHKAVVKDAQAFMDCLNPKPDVFLAVTNNSELNTQLVKAAKTAGCIVYSVDTPALSDFILPAVAKVGDVRISVSTGGRSPAMARELRQRIEKLITPEDLLEIELQEYLRSALKTSVPDQHERGKFLNEILNNVDIKQALRDGKLCVAKELALKHLQGKEALKK